MTKELAKTDSEEKKELVTSPKRIDVGRALKLRMQGNTLEEIAAVLDCTKQGVHYALTRFEPFIKDLQHGDLTAFAEERKSILNAAEMTLLRSVLDEQAIQKAPLAARVMAYGTIYDKRRLEEGKTTENLGVLGRIIIEAEDGLGKPTKDKDSK